MHVTARSVENRKTWLLAGAMFVLLGLTLVALRAGAVEISLSDFFALLLGREVSDALSQTVLFELRLPRVLFAIIVGGALA
jgi:iron complex transport system permease protein